MTYCVYCLSKLSFRLNPCHRLILSRPPNSQGAIQVRVLMAYQSQVLAASLQVPVYTPGCREAIKIKHGPLHLT